MEPVKTDLTVTHAVLTHTGLLREANEDDFVALPAHGVYLVADGMGGHVAGQLASEICVQTVANFFGDEREDDSLVDADGYTSLSPEALELAEALLLANQRIYDRAAANSELAGMGTTGVAIRIIENRVAVSHAGDSRCYLFRDGELAQVTADHSLSNFLLALGRELEARYAEQTMSNVIMRALGLEPEVAVDTKEFLVQSGDRLLLCSDGLSDLVSDEVIAAKLGEYGPSLDEVVSFLVDRALDAGGRDNITALLVELGGVAPPLPRASFSETLDLPASLVTGELNHGAEEREAAEPE
jgi:protein phosphatase